MTDQQRSDTIGAWGHRHMVTPNLDKLSSESVNFTKAFACGATCVSSRAAMFTGMYPHNTGVYTFNKWAHQRTWVHDLRDAGYYCTNIGKMHVSPRDDMLAFDERVVVENPAANFLKRGVSDDDWGRYLTLHGKKRPGDRHRSDPDWRKKFQGVPWEEEEQFHPDVFIGNSALAWIRNFQGDGPVFLQVGFTGPHEPYHPLKRHLELYNDRHVPEASVKEGELETKPPQHQAHQYFNDRFDQECQIALPHASFEDISRMRRHYYANVTTMDEKIGQIMDALKDRGYLENALVIFTSDHGDMLGDHGLPYKWLMYDAAVNIPLMIRDTGANRRLDVEDLVSHIDIGPTILQHAGLDVNKYYEGRSLLPFLEGCPPGEPSGSAGTAAVASGSSDEVGAGRSGPARGAADFDADLSGNIRLGEYVFCEDNYLTMARSRKYKLVYYTGQEEDGELYDLESDPEEFENLFHHRDYQSVKTEMKEVLLHWLLRSTYRTAGYKNTDFKHPRLWPQKHPYLHGAAESRPDSWSVVRGGRRRSSCFF